MFSNLLQISATLINFFSFLPIQNSYVCGCRRGLTCAVVEKRNNNIDVYRCVQVLPEAKEFNELQIDRFKNATAEYTARELMRLLKLFRSKPKPSEENINPTTEKCDDVKTAQVGK